ncbi:MAG: hypothetical protein J1E60_07700 [Christensenellaceae bacterium]|nr:hypothetical protein [Christensenellaceae bacterium]
MNKLFVLSGASGAGKSTLLDRLVKEGLCKAAIKYSERKRFSTVDDVSAVEDVNDPELQCDIVYSMYGNRYGFSSTKLRAQLQEGNVTLITNDKPAIDRLKNLFPQQIVVIYIVSDVNKRLLGQIYLERHGFTLTNNIHEKLFEHVRKTEKMLLQNNGQGFIQCLETINSIIDDIAFQEKEFRLRLESISNQEELYSLNLFMYDYTVLNLYSSNSQNLHTTESAFEQLKRIVNKETGDKK